MNNLDPKSNNWISVKDGFPEINCECAVRTTNHQTLIMSYHQGFDRGKRDFWIWMFGKWMDQTKQVTHYIQLPPIPSTPKAETHLNLEHHDRA